MDLRRRALGGGKTVSRKAAANEASEGANATPRGSSAASSRQSSRNTSRNPSRNPSRVPSEDEDAGSFSDDTAMSGGSFEDLADVPDDDQGYWTQELGDVITNILDRKRSSVQGREEAFAAYCRLSKFHYVQEELFGRVGDLIAAFCKSIKLETSVRETTLALRALELLSLSAYDNTIYENVEPMLSRTIRDSTSYVVKATAIQCLGACAVFGGAGQDGMMDQMTFFLDIIASDGQSIDATDDADCVEAALAEWGHLATYVWDLAAESEEAIQIFADQLDSNDTGVQIAAGENIALLYEKSYSRQFDYANDDDDDDNQDGVDEEEEQLSYEGPRLVKRYEAYHNTIELVQQLQSLATAHSKRISKRDKKSLHSNFLSIKTTVEDPRRGPMYNTAIDQETNKHYGSKFTVKVGRDSAMKVDRWWKWIRLNNFRRMLQGGFAVHYHRGNRAMLENLPVVFRDIQSLTGDRSRTKKHGRRGDTRKFAIHDQSDEE